MSTLGTVGLGSRTSELTPASDGPMMLKVVEDRLSEEKERGEEIEVSPVLTTSDVDDYPDGGLAAWSIVLGVSPSTISSSFGVH